MSFHFISLSEYKIQIISYHMRSPKDGEIDLRRSLYIPIALAMIVKYLSSAIPSYHVMSCPPDTNTNINPLLSSAGRLMEMRLLGVDICHLGDLSEHDQRVGVHGGDSAQRLARIEGLHDDGHFGMEHDLGLVSSLDIGHSLHLGVAGALSHFPVDRHHLARRLGGADMDRRREASFAHHLSALLILLHFAAAQFAGMVLDKDQRRELLGCSRWFRVLFGQLLDVEAHVVTAVRSLNIFVVHLDAEDVS